MHIAIIMDGNGRWASSRGLPRTEGHRRGVEVAREMVRAAGERQIEHLTLYAWSKANFQRPVGEVEAIMRLLEWFVGECRSELLERGVRVTAIGELDLLPAFARRPLDALIEETAARPARMQLTLALAYAARRDLAEAARALCAQARAGIILPEEVDEAMLRSELQTGAAKDPDLVIRTGGERRMSDFLLYEAAFAELHFSDVLWPAFSVEDLDAALADYAGRQRRFGRTPEQMPRSGAAPAASEANVAALGSRRSAS
jgi:undecaprenyl diphosphate synthase